MPRYIRAFVPGGTFFFTVNLLQRDQRLLADHVEALRAAFRQVRKARPFTLNANVVLPDHLHCIWTLPPSDSDFSTRWRLIKGSFARQIESGEVLSERRIRKNERGIWQRRFWEHQIRDEKDFATHADYIHFNPVKHGHAARAVDWPHSSFRRYVEAGVYDSDWGASEDVRNLSYE